MDEIHLVPKVDTRPGLSVSPGKQATEMTSYTYQFAELGDEAHGLGCKCCRITSGADLPISSRLNAEDTKGHAKRFSASVIKDFGGLNSSIKRFRSTIERRWLKKSVQQRRQTLYEAWPEMAPGHRPDFTGFRSIDKNAPRYAPDHDILFI